MYRPIVAARIRGIFVRPSAGDAEAVVRSLAPRFTYRFHGDHALAAMRALEGLAAGRYSGAVADDVRPLRKEAR